MAARKDFYFRELVTEAELDSAFEGLEDADRQLAIDHGMVGVAIAMVVAQQASPNFTVQVSGPGVAYDQAGQRIAIPTTQNVNCALDEDGLTTAVTTPGNSKKLAVFAEFDRDLSDPRVDGNGDTINFARDEGFKLNVVQGAEAGSPSLVPLRSDQILLADITIAFGATTIVTGNLSVARRQDVVRTSATPYAVVAGSAKDAALAVLQALNALANDLADTTTSSDGAAMIGTQTSGNLSGATVRAQLTELDTEKVSKAGDTMSANLVLSGSAEVNYSSPRTKVIMIPLVAATPATDAGGNAVWQLLTGAGPPNWLSRASQGELMWDLSRFLKSGMVISQIRAIIDPTGAGQTGSNRINVGLFREILDFATPAVVASTTIASAFATASTGAIHVVTLAAIAHTVDLSVGGYFILVKASTDGASGDGIHGLEITVTDPGPRSA